LVGKRVSNTAEMSAFLMVEWKVSMMVVQKGFSKVGQRAMTEEVLMAVLLVG
jgi:hypothetical protein